MDTSALKSFAQEARRYLLDIVSKKVEFYLTTDSIEIRAKQREINELKEEIAKTSKDRVIEQVAYTWFNRFCALRFMDVNQYTPIGIISPLGEETQPEILKEAKTGHIKTEFGNETSRARIIDLLSGKIASPDSQAEAYRGLLVLACNYYNSTMPFLFERIDHYTELLLPDDLLSENSILSSVRKAITQDNCKDVEIIGWLYQFYISEKKDEVFEALKKNKKITPENIPAATQLFTPNWIVRYLVENSLGRLWMLNRPSSKLIEKMEYYIKPESEETDFLKIKSVEEIKICDPACGSGHMLVYAFELLYAIYEEEGFSASEIPSKILLNNLFGIEIDERAGELAALALTMKAREKHRRYFSSITQPKICVLENIHFEEREIKEYMDHVGHDLFSLPLQNTLRQFEEAKNFGSLIRPEVTDVEAVKAELEKKKVAEQLFLSVTNEKVLKVLEQTSYLSPKYHVVIANPPYMGIKKMNFTLKHFAVLQYKNSSNDFFSMFIERGFRLLIPRGYHAMITMQSWMYLSSFQKLRENVLVDNCILSMVHLGTNAFETIGGEVVSTTACILSKTNNISHLGEYVDLTDGKSESEKVQILDKAIINTSLRHYASLKDFQHISGTPIAYKASSNVRKIFAEGISIETIAKSRAGLQTGENDKYIRFWYEVGFDKLGLTFSSANEAKNSHFKWFPYNSGGGFRKWYGNNEKVINWENDGFELKEDKKKKLEAGLIEKKNSECWNSEFYFLRSITWSKISTSNFGVRLCDQGFLFDIAGSSIFPPDEYYFKVAGFLCSKVASYLIKLLNPTINIQSGNVATLPWLTTKSDELDASIGAVVQKCLKLAENDWDSRETSWNFSCFPLCSMKHGKISSLYEQLELLREQQIGELMKLEEQNNLLFIKAYGLEEEVTPEVAKEDLTLFSNPAYLFGEGDFNELREKMLLNTLKELISYSVGCMFGRYGLNKPGLILANQGEALEDYLKLVPAPAFFPDEDNVIPILDNDWFVDDIASFFIKFLKVTFGETNLNENLNFIEDALGKDIRKYFAKDFYNDHIKMYKKRPIYWMFSSPKGTFNALIYMHRYTPDTVSIVLNNYLREFRTKLLGKKENLERLSISGDASSKDKTSALKEIEQLKKMILELDEYEKDILYPLATQKIAIDLDDGVKVNYLKFGKALKPIKGLDKDED